MQKPNSKLSFPDDLWGDPIGTYVFPFESQAKGRGVPATSSLFLLGSTCTEGALVSRESPWLLNLVFKNIEKVMDLPQ